MIELILTGASIFLILFCICGILLCRRNERKRWNGGICPVCGNNLRHFDTDSQNGHGWVCDKCNYITWVS